MSSSIRAENKNNGDYVSAYLCFQTDFARRERTTKAEEEAEEIEKILKQRGVRRESFREIAVGRNRASEVCEIVAREMIDKALMVSEDGTIVIQGDSMEESLRKFREIVCAIGSICFEEYLRRVPRMEFSMEGLCVAIGMDEKATLVDVVRARGVKDVGGSSSDNDDFNDATTKKKKKKKKLVGKIKILNQEGVEDIVKYLPRDERAVGFCFYLHIGSNRPCGKLRVIALPPVAPKASAFSKSTSEDVLKRQASVSRISAIASALRDFNGMSISNNSINNSANQNEVLARRWRKNSVTRLLHAMLIDDTSEDADNADDARKMQNVHKNDSRVFQKYFRSVCIINGSVPFGGKQIANVAAATAILPPAPPPVKKITQIQQEKHQKQNMKKILELETRAGVTTNTTTKQMIVQKQEADRLERKLMETGGANARVPISNVSPIPFQFEYVVQREGNEEVTNNTPPTPQNLNFQTPQMDFQHEGASSTYPRKRTPLSEIPVIMPSPPITAPNSVNAASDDEYYVAIINELKLNLELERKRTEEAEIRSMKSSEAESIWLSRMSAARHEDEKRRDELEMLRQLHAEMQARAKDSEEKANVIEERCKEYRKLSSELEVECSRLRAAALKAESLANGFEQELQGKTKMLEAESAELDRVLEKFASSEEECTKARALSRLLQKQLDETNRKLDDTVAKLENSESREDVLKHRLNALEEDRELFRARAEDAEAALQPTKLLAKKQQDEIKSREADRDVAYAAADFARRTNASVSAQRDKLLADCALLREKLAVTEAAAKAALSRIDFANADNNNSFQRSKEQQQNSSYESPSWLHEFASFSRVIS